MSHKMAKWFGLYHSKGAKVTPENVAAATVPSEEIAAETRDVQISFIQKILELERKSSRVRLAMVADALANVNGVRK